MMIDAVQAANTARRDTGGQFDPVVELGSGVCAQVCDDVRLTAAISFTSLHFSQPRAACPVERRVADVPRKRKHETQIPVLHPDAAGVDIGADEIFIAVPPDRDTDPVRRFATFTPDLQAAAEWLSACGIRTVAMESTSVYWIPFYQILEERGFEVYLVNAQYVRNVPGRKTDVSDCQWIQYLHSVGLLRASFRPPNVICAIRSLWRHRESLLQAAANHIRHMQKALDQMNVQLHHVLSDITGVNGLRILDAICVGEHDPVILAALCDRRVKNTKETIARALTGDYRPEHVFALKQSLKGYRFYQQLIADVDKEVQQQMLQVPDSPHAAATMPPRTKKSAMRSPVMSHSLIYAPSCTA